MLLKACMGKSVSGGGLNVSNFREEMADMFPEKREQIVHMTRKQLTNLCKRDKEIQGEIKEAKARYFLPGTPLNERQQAYCACLNHVSAKNPASCYVGPKPEWKKGPRSQQCLNPFSVCSKSTKRKGRFHCLKYYDFDNMPQDEVKAISALHGKTVKEARKFIQDEYKNKETWKQANYKWRNL